MTISNPDFYYEQAERKTDWSGGHLKELLEFINFKYREGDLNSILEVGCGMGKSIDFLPSGINYTGVDALPYAIEKAKQKYPRRSFTVASAERLPFADDTFDLVFSHQVLEMFSKPEESLKEMMRIVKPDGYIAVIAPNFERPWSFVPATRHLGATSRFMLFIQRMWDSLRRLFGITVFRVLKESYAQATGRFERGDDDMLYLTSSREIATLFRRSGFKIMRRDSYWAGGIFFIAKKLS